MDKRIRKATDEQVREAHERYMADDSLRMVDVATELGMARESLGQRFKKLGLQAKPNCFSGSYNRDSNGKCMTGDGYVFMKLDKDDPFIMAARSNGWMLEHRYVMAKYLDRPLYSWETVHHIDGDRTNNDITNLQLRIGSHGAGQAYHCMDCGSDRVSPKELV